MPTHEKKKRSHPGEKPTSVWELYNEAADTRDEELLKDWDYNINSLLLFAAIFASVLISLCVESQQMLQQNPLDVIQQTVTFIALKEVNASASVPTVTPFQPEPWAVAVNGYFFSSLTASILAAIGAVMCQQWVGEYDAGLDAASTPEQRALRCHYRYRSTKQWYMNQMITALPILLYISVALFFIGLVVWFQNTYPALAVIPLVGLLIGASGYLITTFLAVFYPSAPYRTSLSRLLFRIIWLSRFYIWFSIHSFIILWGPWMDFMRNLIVDFTKGVPDKIRSIWAGSYHTQDTTSEDTTRYRDKFVIEYAQYTRTMKIKQTHAFPWIHPARDHWQSMHAQDWERGHVAKDRTLHLSALTWLANSIHLSPHSKREFELLLNQLNSMDERHLRKWSAHKYDAPWGHIFHIVLSPSRSISSSTGSRKPIADDIETPFNDRSRDIKPMASTSRSHASSDAAIFPRSASPLRSTSPPSRHGSLVPNQLVGDEQPQKSIPQRSLTYESQFSQDTILHRNMGDLTLEKGAEEMSNNRSIDILSAVSQLLGKMANHPDLFERTISRTSDTVIVEFMVQLSKHRPSNEGQALNRLRSITSLFTLKRWQKMDASIQPVYPTFKVILDCLRVGNVALDEKSVVWIFTLCSVDADNYHIPWPNPEFVGVISYPLKHEDLKRRAIKYYIEYADALLTRSPLPLSENRTWRWRNPEVEPDEASQTPLLQILAEYLLKGLAAMESARNRSELSEFLADASRHSKSVALRAVIEAYQFRMLETAALPRTSVVLHTYIPDQEKRPVSSIPCDEPTLYAAMFCLGVRNHVPLRLTLLQSTKVILAAFEVNKPRLDAMLYRWIMENRELLTCEDWIAILRTLSERETLQDLEHYNAKMIELIPLTWLAVFTQIFKEMSVKENWGIIKCLLSALRSHLPDQIARKRWELVMERISRSNGHITGFRRVVDMMLLRLAPSKGARLGTATTPLPRILEKILTTLAGLHSIEEPETVAPYIRIVDELTTGYASQNSWDELFLIEFRYIAHELKRTRRLFGNVTTLDNTAFPDSKGSLNFLLKRIEGLKDGHSEPYNIGVEPHSPLNLQYLPDLQRYSLRTAGSMVVVKEQAQLT